MYISQTFTDLLYFIIIKTTIFLYSSSQQYKNFSTCAFFTTQDSRFLYKKKKVNKRTKIYDYVKRENVAIATHLPPQVVWLQ